MKDQNRPLLAVYGLKCVGLEVGILISASTCVTGDTLVVFLAWRTWEPAADRWTSETTTLPAQDWYNAEHRHSSMREGVVVDRVVGVQPRSRVAQIDRSYVTRAL